MQLTEATLGIDLGSTSSRAFLWCPGNGAEHHVENKSRNNLTSTRYEKGDFSSTGFPFDDNGPVYLGETPNPDRQSTSLKHGFYPLAEASTDELIHDYSLVQPLWARRNDPTFRARLLEGLRGLLSTIQRRVNQICRAKRLSVTIIGLSVPSQWTLEFENVYRDLVVEVFNHPPADIYFHTETEALAHYLVKNHINELNGVTAVDVLLLLDFGGHNMNGCLFCVVSNQDGDPSFYGIGRPFGAGGGSEQWEYNIGTKCAEIIRRAYNHSLSARNRQRLLDNFNREKTNLGPGNSRSVTFICEENGTPWKVMLDSQNIDQCFADALKGPLQVAADRIAELSKINGSKRKVVVSGGTCRNRALQAYLRKLCKNAGLPAPLFTDSLEINYETLKIAKGVAYAAGGSGSIEDFFRRGAAFGLQMRQRPTRGNSNPDRLWDDRAFFLLDKNHQTTRRVSVNGREELRIVCDPFWAEKHDAEEEEELPYNTCYNVLYLGKPTRGYWLLRLSVTGSGDSMSLLLEGSRQPCGSRRRRAMVPKRFPLQFDRGTNCVYIGVRGHSLEELGLGMCLDPGDGADEDACTTIWEEEDPEQRGSSGIRTWDPEEGTVRLEPTEWGGLGLEGGSFDEEMSAQVNLTSTAEHRAKRSGSLHRALVIDPSERRQHPYKRPPGATGT